MSNSKKVIILILWLVVPILIVFLPILIITKNNGNDNSVIKSTFRGINSVKSPTEVPTNKSTEIITFKPTPTIELSKPPQNSSEMELYIYRKARNDVKNSTEETRKIALDFVRNNYPNYYKDNITMENGIYYGIFLDYAYRDTDKVKSNLGQDVYQAIKYVYRGIDKITDNSTVCNLDQIKKALIVIN